MNSIVKSHLMWEQKHSRICSVYFVEPLPTVFNVIHIFISFPRTFVNDTRKVS